MTRSTRLYFAYGSNLLPARLAARTPSARIIGPAVLTGNRLAWHKHGVDDSGKCDIVKTGTLADRVFGAVYEIEVDDWNALDRAEEL
ncbi:MAG: gamma-glutamylcyclotransferase family protein, partial [Wenzhouxiangellaceae bacterium]